MRGLFAKHWGLSRRTCLNCIGYAQPLLPYVLTTWVTLKDQTHGSRSSKYHNADAENRDTLPSRALDLLDCEKGGGRRFSAAAFPDLGASVEVCLTLLDPLYSIALRGV